MQDRRCYKSRDNILCVYSLFHMHIDLNLYSDWRICLFVLKWVVLLCNFCQVKSFMHAIAINVSLIALLLFPSSNRTRSLSSSYALWPTHSQALQRTEQRAANSALTDNLTFICCGITDSSLSVVRSVRLKPSPAVEVPRHFKKEKIVEKHKFIMELLITR